MRLRFTIRDLLWLALVVAMTVTIWLQNQKLSTQGRYSVTDFRDRLYIRDKLTGDHVELYRSWGLPAGEFPPSNIVEVPSPGPPAKP
jgi:hypothetical protein